MNNSILNNKRIREVFPEQSIITKLNSGDKLIIKSGIDPTTTDLHFGHLLGLMLLKDFIRLGHRVIFILGDFTAQLGDGIERPQLSLSQTKENSEKLILFLNKFFNSDNFHIRKQSEWFENITFEKLISHFSKISLRKLLSRGTTDEKLSANVNMNLHEFIYPVLMAIDSIETKPDIEMGSIEQKFNLEICRELMEKKGIEPEDVIINQRLRGIDGSEKMSKSQNNFIGIFENTDIQVEKILKIPNDLIFEFLDLLTDITAEEINGLRKSNNWLEAKKLLIFNVLILFHDATDVQNAWNDCMNHGLRNIKNINLKLTEIKGSSIVKILLKKGFITSKREIKRNILSGKIKLNGKGISQEMLDKILIKGDQITIGKNIILNITD